MLGNRQANMMINSTKSANIASLLRRNRRTASRIGERDSRAMPWTASASSRPSTPTSGPASDGVIGVLMSSVKADPRVEAGIEDVRRQVGQDHAEDDEHHPRHQLREVAVLVGGEEEVTHPF